MIHPATLDLIKAFEGLYLEAYQCPAGIWTIGYGHTGIRHNDGTVFKGRTLKDEAEALALLAQDLQVFEAGVTKLLLTRAAAEMTPNMFGALVSFAFNCGLGNLQKSTLLQRINSRDWFAAAGEFSKWNRANGKVLRGLTRRRLAEACLFCSLPRPL